MLRLFTYLLRLVYWDHQPVEKVRAMQLRRFREMFEYAREHSKFYRKLYRDAGVLDLEIKTWEDAAKVPIISKEMMRPVPTEDILTCPFDPAKHNTHTTSGSSGTPFKIVYDKWVDYTGHIRFLYFLFKHGYTPFKKITLLSRYDKSTKFEIEQDLGLIKKLQGAFKIFRRDIISIFEGPDAVISKLREQLPFALWTIPSSLAVVAHELERRNERLHIPLLVLMSETYSEDMIKLFKERICEEFIDNYGCMELPTMGGGYNTKDSKKLIANFVMAEVVDRRIVDGVEMGDFVVTNLLNKTQPFVRYNLGDYVGVIKDPAFPTCRIGRVYGRCDDTIIAPNATIYFHMIYELFTDFVLAEQYKLFQFHDGRLEFQIKLRNGVKAEDAIADARRRWNRKLGNVPVEFVIKDALPVNPKTGKFKVLEKERES